MIRLFLFLSLLWCTAIQAQDGWHQTVMDMAPGCRIRVSVPLDAQVGFGRENRGSGGIRITYPPRARKLSYEEPLMLGFICLNVTDEVVQSGWATKSAEGAWRLNLGPHDRTYYKPGNIAAYQVATPNASGWAVHVDDMMGEERGRRRQLFYCVTHEEKAVCGDSVMGYLPEIRRHSRNDLTPYALRILRSVEFLDDVGIASPSAPAASGPIPAQKH